MMGYPIFLHDISASSTLCKQACSSAIHSLILQPLKHPQQLPSLPLTLAHTRCVREGELISGDI